MLVLDHAARARRGAGRRRRSAARGGAARRSRGREARRRRGRAAWRACAARPPSPGSPGPPPSPRWRALTSTKTSAAPSTRDQVDLAADLARPRVAGDDPPPGSLEAGRRPAPRRCARASGGRRSSRFDRRRARARRDARRSGRIRDGLRAIGAPRRSYGRADARRRPHLRAPRRRGARGAGRGRRAHRPAVVRARRPARRGGARVARARSRRARQLGVRVPAEADHRQPGPGRPAQGRPGLRPRDRRRGARRHRAASRRARSPTSRSPASSPSTARSGRCPGRWRWPRPRAARAPGRSSSRRACGPEAALVAGCGVVPVERLEQLRDARRRAEPPAAASRCGRRRTASRRLPDLADLRGQPALRRALEVAAAGGHSLLISGPPGAGKSMAARRLPSILPPLGADEAIEAARVASACGRPVEPAVAGRRPFRAPHHTISTAGLIGGGNPPRPGEVTLAHQRRALPRRAARVRPRRARGAAPAARGRRGAPRPRPLRDRAAVPVSARRRGQPVSVRRRAAVGRVHLRPGLGARLRGEADRRARRPDRHLAGGRTAGPRPRSPSAGRARPPSATGCSPPASASGRGSAAIARTPSCTPSEIAIGAEIERMLADAGAAGGAQRPRPRARDPPRAHARRPRRERSDRARARRGGARAAPSGAADERRALADRARLDGLPRLPRRPRRTERPPIYGVGRRGVAGSARQSSRR